MHKEILFSILSLFFAVSLEAQEITDEGEYLFRMARCGDCHTDIKNNGKFLAGGRELKTPFGTFYSTNISPETKTGIGNWTDKDFLRALRSGISPNGSHYFPSFPYTSYTNLTDKDISLLWEYLKKQQPVIQENKKHALPFIFSFRFMLGIWKFLFFTEGPLHDAVNLPQAENRGAYLIRAVTHCSECHSPRNMLGAVGNSDFLSGNVDGAESESSSPNITPHKETGIGKWSKEDFLNFMKTGMLPDGDFTGDLMGDVIDTSLAHMKNNDLVAIAEFIFSLQPVKREIKTKKKKKTSDEPWN